MVKTCLLFREGHVTEQNCGGVLNKSSDNSLGEKAFKKTVTSQNAKTDPGRKGVRQSLSQVLWEVDDLSLAQFYS